MPVTVRHKSRSHITLTSFDNLFRAWRWIRSNPDRSYKNYFRDIYSIFALSDIENLLRIKEQIEKGIYEPSSACKVFLPKPSGILRPYTLLTVADQVVYQGLINIVAEKLYPKIRFSYYNYNFGNLYAGTKNIWFYRKWSTGYKKFNQEARKSFKEGLVYTASFDLTACYDSIDHGVLTHFLKKIGCPEQVIKLLMVCLSKWTASERRYPIYHNHGIPQGPLSSGLLSEVVLQHFDQQMIRTKNIKYFRYVDDIRLFARTPEYLKEQLVRLDLLSKEVGLFPQSSKINIHKITNIEDELKTISNPTSQENFSRKKINQSRIIKKINKLSLRYNVKDFTKFKYFLAQARPNSTLNKRIWRIYEKYPDLYPSILNYFSKHETLPKKDVEKFISEIKKYNIYTSVRAAFINTASNKIKDKRLDKIIKNIWNSKGLNTDILAATGKHLMKNQIFKTEKQKLDALNLKKSWYAQSQIMRSLENNSIFLPKTERILNAKILEQTSDVAITAAYLIVRYNLNLTVQNRQSINIYAANIRAEFGYLKKKEVTNQCPIDLNLYRICGYKMQQIIWKNIFISDYDWACKHIIYCRSLADTDTTAWVNAFDVFCDALVKALFAHDLTIGNLPATGDLGGVLSGKSCRFAKKYPYIYNMVSRIHSARKISRLSHAKIRHTKRNSEHIRYRFFQDSKPIIFQALAELKSNW